MSYLTPPTTPHPQPSKPGFGAVSAPQKPGALTPPYSPLVDTKHGRTKAAPAPLLTPPDTPASLGPSWRSVSAEKSQSRLLSENELSYYLPSRQDGVNDMYLHHTLTAPVETMASYRVLLVWAYQLLRHPLLASTVRARSYTDVAFHHVPPTTLNAALEAARLRLSYTDGNSRRLDGGGMIDSYLNGPRTLSSERLAVLHLAAPSRGFLHAEEGARDEAEYQVMLATTHFVGDGMALHTFMNDFYTLLGSARTPADLERMIAQAFETPAGPDTAATAVALPASLEARLPRPPTGAARLVDAVGAEEHARAERKLVGGQAFPPPATKRARRTVVPTFAYDEAQTKAILGNCKKNGVTIAHAMFALCNIAWARLSNDRTDPTLIYSALNLRPNMRPSASPADTSYFHLAVGYFNVVLPCTLPSALTPAELFWHRARATKAQTTAAVKSPFVVSRSRQTSKVRAERAVKWAAIDDAAEAKSTAAAADAANTVEAANTKANANTAANAAANATWASGKPRRTLVGLGLGIDMPDRAAPEPEPTAPAPLAQPSNGIAATRGPVATNPAFAPVRAVESTPSQSDALSSPASASANGANDGFGANGANGAIRAVENSNPAVLPPANQKALMGLSMLGNLDGMYKHAMYPCIRLGSLTTGSRQRPGALLLFAYTFAGKLWLSLGYDINGFADGSIEAFWAGVQALVQEVLL